MVALTARLPRRGRGFWYSVAIDALWPLVVLFVRLRMAGGANIPRRGAVLLASNHLSFADPVTLTAFTLAAGRVPRYLAKASLWKAPVLGWVMSSGRHIPVDRGTARAGRALDAARSSLADGQCVIVYPEGTFSDDPDGWPTRAKNGVARLALTSRTPVVPVAQWGTRELLRPGRLLPRPWTRVHVVAGPPVDLSDLYGPEPTKQVLDTATERVMTAITALLEEVRDLPHPGKR
ncbi:lysophospholipid acyltransferase family protein [Saccharothrix algeriensis]|uniref:1-acyl-sn-glycerol-3-phosphate acyltransferase n=1 Tax=Saccharothrix algeriensis TaxID=173560 RepID=A0A8T8HVH9_9PSEU|nr:lysophospholipid acyltransferase family protein [Saccharothrix algeriensis]MBM7814209.1 1-acyl-sn-glycerol-3-phosphate acyltransferase [Saccharothrix algeriensis]QTR02573.1 1-acyl-sn-glycerol-3-phosphate acyltransferase [Saccharothrix algeriensis]